MVENAHAGVAVHVSRPCICSCRLSCLLSVHKSYFWSLLTLLPPVLLCSLPPVFVLFFSASCSPLFSASCSPLSIVLLCSLPPVLLYLCLLLSSVLLSLCLMFSLFSASSCPLLSDSCSPFSLTPVLLSLCLLFSSALSRPACGRCFQLAQSYAAFSQMFTTMRGALRSRSHTFFAYLRILEARVRPSR